MLAESVAERMKKKGYFANCVCLWVKDTELKSFERQMALKFSTNVSDDIAESAYQLFLENYTWALDIRALGVRVTNLSDGALQCDLFGKSSNLEKKQKLESAIESLRGRFGYNIIRRGNILGSSSLSDLNPHSDVHIIHPVGFFKSQA